MVASAAGEQRWFSWQTAESFSSVSRSWPVFGVDLRFAGDMVQGKPRRDSPGCPQSRPHRSRWSCAGGALLLPPAPTPSLPCPARPPPCGPTPPAPWPEQSLFLPWAPPPLLPLRPGRGGEERIRPSSVPRRRWRPQPSVALHTAPPLPYKPETYCHIITGQRPPIKWEPMEKMSLPHPTKGHRWALTHRVFCF